MDIKTLYEALEENFCKSGEIDKNGFYRNSTGGNVVFLSDDKTGGWAYICKHIVNNGRYVDIVRYSIKPDGRMKNEGKYSTANVLEIQKMLKRATKFAIITPEEDTANKIINWRRIENA